MHIPALICAISDDTQHVHVSTDMATADQTSLIIQPIMGMACTIVHT